MKKILLTLGILVAVVMIGTAQTTVRVKQHNQVDRIQQGVKSGELTKKEAKALAHQQAHIQRDKKRAAADGVITRREAKHIRKEQRYASRSIYRQKHDAQYRF